MVSNTWHVGCSGSRGCVRSGGMQAGAPRAPGSAGARRGVVRTNARRSPARAISGKRSWVCIAGRPSCGRAQRPTRRPVRASKASRARWPSATATPCIAVQPALPAPHDARKFRTTGRRAAPTASAPGSNHTCSGLRQSSTAFGVPIFALVPAMSHIPRTHRGAPGGSTSGIAARSAAVKATLCPVAGSNRYQTSSLSNNPVCASKKSKK